MARSKHKSPMTEKVMLQRGTIYLALARGFVAFMTCLGLALVVLATWPVAHVLAGKRTVLDVSLAITVTVSVTLAGLGAGAWGKYHKRRADRLSQRNRELSRDIKELQERLKSHKLSTKVSR